MKNNPLRVPLINSAVVLAVLALIVYFTVTSGHGSLWSSIGAIFILIFRLAQLAIGLGLALLVSLGVLIGIFLGAVAIFDGAAASRMYEGLRRIILTWTAPLAGLFKSDREEKLAAALADLEQRIGREIAGQIGGLRREMTGLREELAGTIQKVAGRLSQLEAASVSRDELAEPLEAVTAATEAVAALEQGLKKVEDRLDQVAKQAAEVDAASLLGDLPARVEALEQAEPPAIEIPEIPEPVDIGPLEKQIQELGREIDSLREALVSLENAAPAQPAEAETADDAATAPAEDEHRLLSYFDNPEDKRKLADLVAQTLKKDMTYAQVTEFLIREMGEEGGRVISEHPSLAKDYIRQCRRKV